MSEERTQILDLLAAGKITVAEAEKLLNAIDASPAGNAGAGTAARPTPRFLKIEVQSNNPEKGEETVSIRVPLQLLRSGIKLASLMPHGVHDKVNGALQERGMNVDLAKVKPEDLESLVNDLAEMTVDVNSGKDQVRIRCE